jgi:hypothetical protein
VRLLFIISSTGKRAKTLIEKCLVSPAPQTSRSLSRISASWTNVLLLHGSSETLPSSEVIQRKSPYSVKVLEQPLLVINVSPVLVTMETNITQMLCSHRTQRDLSHHFGGPFSSPARRDFLKYASTSKGYQNCSLTISLGFSTKNRKLQLDHPG